jgi:hypothetical protein
LKKQKIFLASSSELKDDRLQFEIYISRKNKELIERGIFLELIMWEDFLDALSQTRLQDEYNKAISESDIFIMLFFTKVGKYTEEEFDKAFNQFKTTNKPLVFTYFKNAPILTSELDDEVISLIQFQKKLLRLGHFYTHYTDIGDLKSHFEQQLSKLIAGGLIEPGQNQAVSNRTTGPSEKLELNDETVKEVLLNLRQLHQESGEKFLPAEKLLPELDLLFNRNTFRFEELRNCPEQRWSDRLHSAYQTLRLLECYARNVREMVPDKYPLYQKLLKEIDGYCMQMGALLFQPSVDYNEIEHHIGKSTFKDHLPMQIRFDTGQSKKPIIANEINDPVESHRLKAVKLINQITKIK